MHQQAMTIESSPYRLAKDGPEFILKFRFPTSQEAWDYWPKLYRLNAQTRALRPDQAPEKAAIVGGEKEDVPETLEELLAHNERSRLDWEQGIALVVGVSIDGTPMEGTDVEIREFVSADYRHGFIVLAFGRSLFRAAPILGAGGPAGGGGAEKVGGERGGEPENRSD